MSCEDYRRLITGYVDDELSVADRERLESHLRACDACQRERDELVAFKEHLTMIKFKEPSDAELERYWKSIYNRLERGLGWILFSLGAIVVSCWVAFEAIEEVIKDPNVSLLLKVGIVSLIVGGVVLFVSIVRERLTIRKTDKYSREVER